MGEPAVAIYDGFYRDVLILLGFFAVTFVAWFFAFRDIGRRDDLGTWGEIAWGAVVILLGIVGVVLYFLFRPRGVTQAERDARQQASDEFVRKHTALADTAPVAPPPTGPPAADQPGPDSQDR